MKPDGNRARPLLKKKSAPPGSGRKPDPNSLRSRAKALGVDRATLRRWLKKVEKGEMTMEDIENRAKPKRKKPHGAWNNKGGDTL